MDRTLSEPLVMLQRGFVTPVTVFNLVLACEAIGIRLWLERENDCEVIRADGPVTPEILAELRAWKPHVIAILKYVPDDRHLFDPSVPFAEHGPVVNGGARR